MSTLSFAKYGMFIYTQPSVIKRLHAQKKMDFMIFLFSLRSEVSDLQKVKTKPRPVNDCGNSSCQYGEQSFAVKLKNPCWNLQTVLQTQQIICIINKIVFKIAYLLVLPKWICQHFYNIAQWMS